MTPDPPRSVYYGTPATGGIWPRLASPSPAQIRHSAEAPARAAVGVMLATRHEHATSEGRRSGDLGELAPTLRRWVEYGREVIRERFRRDVAEVAAELAEPEPPSGLVIARPRLILPNEEHRA
jgi:hypothetical protein